MRVNPSSCIVLQTAYCSKMSCCSGKAMWSQFGSTWLHTNLECAAGTYRGTPCRCTTAENDYWCRRARVGHMLQTRAVGACLAPGCQNLEWTWCPAGLHRGHCPVHVVAHGQPTGKAGTQPQGTQNTLLNRWTRLSKWALHLKANLSARELSMCPQGCMHACHMGAQQTSALWLPSGCRCVQGFLLVLLALSEQQVHIMCRWN